MTTMVLERRVMGIGGRRWRGTMVHGGVMLALLAGLACLWSAVAVLVALLAQPSPTMATLERHGLRGVPMVIVDGSVTALKGLRLSATGAAR